MANPIRSKARGGTAAKADAHAARAGPETLLEDEGNFVPRGMNAPHEG